MANSLILSSPSALVGVTRPKVVKHPSVRPGTKFLFDFTDPRCHPGGAISAGAKSTATAFSDISGNNISAVTTTSNWSVNADGSLAQPAAVGSYINVGTAGQYDMSAALIEYLAIVWVKLPASGYTTGAYGGLLSYAKTNANDAQVLIDLGTDNLRPRADIGGLKADGTTATSVATGVAADVTPGTPMQIASHFKPSTSTLEMFLNGALIGTGLVSQTPASLIASPAAFMQLVGRVAGAVYGASFHDIGASITAETAQGLAAPLTAAQHVLQDYQFGMGTLTGSPRTAYS